MLRASALLILAPLVHADVMIAPQAVSVASGAVVSVRLVVTNAGAESMSWSVKRELAARLHSASARSEDAELTTSAPEGERIIPPGGYLQLPYQFRLRPGLFGPVVLELTQIESQPVMFSIRYGEDGVPGSVAPAGRPANDSEEIARETALRRSTRPLSDLSRYEPVYFGMGGNGGAKGRRIHDSFNLGSLSMASYEWGA